MGVEIVGRPLNPGGFKRLLSRLVQGRRDRSYEGHEVLSAAAPVPPTAVIVPAHNEEAVIEATLSSLVRVYPPADVFVFADACTDRTVEIARSFLPFQNVIDHTQNIGKSRGIEWTLHQAVVPAGYEYVTVVDADTTLDPAYPREVAKALADPRVVCVAGQIKTTMYATSLFGVYRSYVYFMWQAVFKRIQSYLNAVTIAPGTSSTWRTSVLSSIPFDHRMSTEDFALTFEVHRQRLGRIKYVASAVVYTQDPFTLTSFRKQSYRWSRAWWESVRKYRVGLRLVRFHHGLPAGASAVDLFACALIASMYAFWLKLAVLPLLLIHPVDLGMEWLVPSSRESIGISAILQVLVLTAPMVLTAVVTRRSRIAVFAPVVLAISLIDVAMSLAALYSTARSQYRRVATRGTESVWSSPVRGKVAADQSAVGDKQPALQ